MNAAPTREHVVDDLNRVAHPLVGIKHNLARDAAQIAAREREAEFAPCRLVTTAFVEARPHDVELSLAHRALQAEQEAIVVERWIVDPVAVGNQGAGERTDLKELVPVATGAGQARDLEAEHEADMAETNLGDQPLETGAALGGGGRKTEILVDDHDLGAWPAQSASSVGEAVLELSGLAVVLDLLEGGLPDVDDGEPIKMMGGHLVRRADWSGRKVGVHARSPRPGWPGAALPSGRSPRSAGPAAPKAGRTRMGGGPLARRAVWGGRRGGVQARPPGPGGPGAALPGGGPPRPAGPAAPKAGRTRTALAGGSSRPSRPALQPTSASRAFALTTGPEKESTSSAEVPRPRDVHARAIPEDQLDPVSSFGPEHVNCARERVGAHRLTHERRQAIHPLAEVDRACRHHDAHRARGPDHDAAFTAQITAAIASGLAPDPIRTTMPSISTSIPMTGPGWRARCGCGAGGGGGPGDGSTTAGTNRAGALGHRERRASRRQVNSCAGVSPCRRATPHTVLPGA